MADPQPLQPPDNPPPGSVPPAGGAWTWADGAWQSLDEPPQPETES